MPERVKQQLIYVILALLSIAVIVLLYIGDFSSKIEKTPTLKKQQTEIKPIEKSQKIELIETVVVDVDKKEIDEIVDIEKKEIAKKHFSCVDFKLGSYRLTPTCKQRLKSEFSTQNIEKVEIIGVVDSHDFIVLEELNMSDKQHNYIKTLASEGLGFLRANEATWYINKYKDSNTTLKNSSYILKTASDRGFTLKFN